MQQEMKDLSILLEVRSKVYMWLFNRKYKYKVFRPDIPEDAIRSDSPYNEVLIETNSRSELRIWMDLNGYGIDGIFINDRFLGSGEIKRTMFYVGQEAKHGKRTRKTRTKTPEHRQSRRKRIELS